MAVPYGSRRRSATRRRLVFASLGTLALGSGAGLAWLAADRVGRTRGMPDASAGDSRSKEPADRLPSAMVDAPRPAERTQRPWRPVDERFVGALPVFEDAWSAEGRVLVDVSEAAFRAPAWRVGDRLVVDLPQFGGTFESEIEQITEGPDRSRSARGFFVDADGRRRRLVVTVGPMHVLAYIDTARGPYELVGDNRLGWLLPTSSMLAAWDFSKSDILTPDRIRDIRRAGGDDDDG